MLTCGLLALAGCGGGTKVVTKTVTAPANGSGSTPAPKPTTAAGPSAAAIAAARAFDSAAIAADVAQAGSPLGDAVFATAAIAAAETLSTQKTTTANRTAPAPAPRRVVSGQASGDFAVAYTNGTFHHPSAIVLNIAASPPQSGSVDWNVVCFENSGGIGRKQGRETLQVPTTKTLPLPAPSSSCIASANVQLSKTGTVTISISG